jgi:hypothetical protein
MAALEVAAFACEDQSVSTAAEPGDAVKNTARQLDSDFADWLRSLSHSEIAELKLYQGTGYLTINPLLRDEVSAASYDEAALFRWEGTIEAIDSAIAKGSLQSDLRVYRGLRDPEAVFGVADVSALANEVINEPAFLSTSLDAEVALRMTVTSPTPLLLQLDLRAGQTAAWLALAGDQRRRLEYELLLPRRLRIRIRSVNTGGGTPSLEGSVEP